MSKRLNECFILWIPFSVVLLTNGDQHINVGEQRRGEPWTRQNNVWINTKLTWWAPFVPLLCENRGFRRPLVIVAHMECWYYHWRGPKTESVWCRAKYWKHTWFTYSSLFSSNSVATAEYSSCNKRLYSASSKAENSLFSLPVAGHSSFAVWSRAWNGRGGGSRLTAPLNRNGKRGFWNWNGR